MISKSQYIKAMQCHKALWLHKHRKDLMDERSIETTVSMASGISVGELAQQLFPNGELIEFDASSFNGMINRTSELIKQGCDTIYEGCFRAGGAFAMADILTRSGNANNLATLDKHHVTGIGANHEQNGKADKSKQDDSSWGRFRSGRWNPAKLLGSGGRQEWEMYEVKASTSVKEYHLLDSALQWYALSNAGLKLSRAAIIHINNKYERQGQLDIQSLFTIADITEKVVEMQGEIPARLQEIETMLKGGEPEIDIGPHCTSPFTCDFYNHCWQKIPKQSVFNLYRMRANRRWDLYHQGVISLKDLPDDTPLSRAQKLQVQCLGKKEPVIDRDIIRKFLENTSSPMNYLDFETFNEAIPRFDGQRPYQQIPFQYSLHVEHGPGNPGKAGAGNSANGVPSGDVQGQGISNGAGVERWDHEEARLTHREFLADVGLDPRRALAEQLLADMPDEGKIVAYYASFERRVIRQLAVQFDDLSDELLALNDRVIDLLVPFRALGYYHDRMNGSFSLKFILPALFPDDNEIGYQGLAIQDGGTASSTFATLHQVESSYEVERIRNDLLAYCRMDTLALVRVMNRFRELVARA